MRIKKDVLSGAAAVCIAVAFMFPSLRLGVASLTSDGVPGPGFFPFFVSLLVIGLGVALILKGFLRKDADEYATFVFDDNSRKVFVTVAAFAAYLALWRVSDFFLSSALLVVFLNFYYARSLKFNIVYTIVFILMVYLVFYRFLRIYFVI